MERCAAVCIRRAFSVLQFFVTFSLRVGPLSGYAVCAPKRRKMRFGAGAPGEKSEKAEHLGDVRLLTYSDIMMQDCGSAQHGTIRRHQVGGF